MQPGDIAANLEGNVLYLSGKGAKMGDLACTVGLARRLTIAKVQTTADTGGVFEVLLPANAAAPVTAPEAIAAA
jgi:hypothetical protein